MTEQQITGPTFEQLIEIESELTPLLTKFFVERGVPPAVGLSILASALGKGLNAYSDPADVDRTLGMVFRSIRHLATGGNVAGSAH